MTLTCQDFRHRTWPINFESTPFRILVSTNHLQENCSFKEDKNHDVRSQHKALNEIYLVTLRNSISPPLSFYQSSLSILSFRTVITSSSSSRHVQVIRSIHNIDMASSHKRLTDADWLDHKAEIQNMLLCRKLSNSQIVDALEKRGLHAK